MLMPVARQIFASSLLSPTPGARSPEAARALLLGIILVGALLRVLWQFFGPATDTPDTAVYIATGDALFATGRMSSVVYMPLYPILIHLAGYHGIVWLQLLLSTVTILLVHRVALALWNDGLAALLSAALVALHPVLIYYANLRLSETAFIFFFTLAVMLIYESRVFLAALAFVLANLVRPSFDYILPLLIITGVFATAKAPSLSSYARSLAVFAATYIAVMSPWWLHNYEKYGRFIRLDLAGGITAVLENSRSFEQHGLDWSVDPPWEAFDHIADPVAKDEAMKTAALAYVRAHPWKWFANDFDRLRRFLTPWPGPSIGTFQKIVCTLATLPFMLGALFSIGMLRSRWRRALPVLLPIAFLTALHVSTHALMRYRLPLDPLLIVLAGAPLALLLRNAARCIAGAEAPTEPVRYSSQLPS
jgi:hypothetical protein